MSADVITAHPEQNKLIVRRYYDEFLNTGDLDHAGEVLGFDLRQHSTMDIPDGLEGFRSFMAPWYAAFPDLRYSIEDIYSEGNMVFVRSKVTGTNTGEFRGRSPTGRRFEVWQIDAYRVESDRIVEHWDMVDFPSLFRQVGLQL